MTSTTLLVIGVLAVAVVAVLVSCRGKSQERSDKEIFEEVLNDPRVNSREVGEREGIEFFQVMKDGKTGFRDLDGNVVIEPKYKSAEMFSEGLSAVQVTEKGKYGFINTKGEMVIAPTFEYAGSFSNGLAAFRVNDLYGFIDWTGKEAISPRYAWVDQFSEGFCVVRDALGKHAFIDLLGKQMTEFKFQSARGFEGGKAKVCMDNKWGAIDMNGDVVVDFTHEYADFD